MEMWCPDDVGRDSWDWVGPPAWGRACFNSPEWRGGSSPVKTEPPQIVILSLMLVFLFQGGFRCEVCTTTNDQSCNESLRRIYTEPSMMKNSLSSRAPACTTAKRGAIIEIVSRFARAKHAEETATRSIDSAHFSVQTEWRTNASGFEFTAT